MDAQNAPTGTWKTAQTAVSHSAHTHPRFIEEKDDDEEEQKPTTSNGFTHKIPDSPRSGDLILVQRSRLPSAKPV
jgi:hypothetical protein